MSACALELYNEDLLDLSLRSGRDETGVKNGWDSKGANAGLKLQERPVGKDGRVVPEVRERTALRTAALFANFHTLCASERVASDAPMALSRFCQCEQVRTEQWVSSGSRSPSNALAGCCLRPQVVGAHEKKVNSAAELAKFYNDCMHNRSTGSTKLNDRSSRSHAIFTINIHRTTVEVSKPGDDPS